MATRGQSLDLLRLVTRIARMYHEQQATQQDIAAKLGITQTRVSRLLKQAQAQGIVKTTVHAPLGVHAELEEALEAAYGLPEAVVVETAGDDDDAVIRGLSTTAAGYLEYALASYETIGTSSWSETLLATVDAMRPAALGQTRRIIQLIGGLGRSGAQNYATRLTEHLARLTGAEPVFLLSPGIVVDERVKDSLLSDDSIREIFASYAQLSAILVGIGSLSPSRLLRTSGNGVSADDEAKLRELGAVGDICLRYFDAEGRPLTTELDRRIVGISQAEVMATPRRIAIAGGERKFDAIRASLRGRWVNVLITDVSTARRLIEQP